MEFKAEGHVAGGRPGGDAKNRWRGSRIAFHDGGRTRMCCAGGRCAAGRVPDCVRMRCDGPVTAWCIGLATMRRSQRTQVFPWAAPAQNDPNGVATWEFRSGEPPITAELTQFRFDHSRETPAARWRLRGGMVRQAARLDAHFALAAHWVECRSASGGGGDVPPPAGACLKAYGVTISDGRRIEVARRVRHPLGRGGEHARR